MMPEEQQNKPVKEPNKLVKWAKKVVGLCKAAEDWVNANAYHYKGHGTHQEHLDEMHRILEERRRQPGYRDPDEDYSWVPILLSAYIGAVLIVVYTLVTSS